MDSVQRHINKTHRTFIAVNVTPDNDFEAYLQSLRSLLRNEDIVWNRRENFHITLLFIGETQAEMILPISEVLDKVAEQVKSFHFYISGAGVFRTINHPRVLWLGLIDSKELSDIKKLVDGNLFPFLKTTAFENFKPHLTIGRMRKIKDLNLLKEIIQNSVGQVFQQIKVEEIIFYESITTPDGPVYKVLSAHPLQ